MNPESDLEALRLTLELASLTTLLLLAIGTPLAFWLATARARWTAWVGGIVSLPLVLPPAVLGFYLLLAMAPDGPVGRLTTALGLGTLAFRFAGLLVGSTIYSLPFVVEPLRTAFRAVGAEPLEAAATLGAGP